MVIKNVCFIIKISVSVSTSIYQAMYKIPVSVSCSVLSTVEQ